MGALRRTIDGLFETRRIDAPERELDQAARWRHVRRHGSFPLAYAAVAEPYLKSFGDRRGFIAYGQKMGYTFALGDPICPCEHADSLIGEFMGIFGKPDFVAVGEGTARLLAGRGFRVNRFGHDTAVELPGHSFAGGEGKRIRYATSWLKANGLRIEERSLADFPPGSIATISEKWRRTRVVRREVRFLNRVLSMQPSPDVRTLFVLDADDAPIGFISFDPLYRDGRVVAYLASQKRRAPEGSAYLDLALMRHAIDLFKAEGLEACHLGLSPLASRERGPFRDDPATRWLFARAYGSAWMNRHIFNLQGIAAYKSRFRGREIPAYIAMPGGFNPLRIVALLRLCRIV